MRFEQVSRATKYFDARRLLGGMKGHALFVFRWRFVGGRRSWWTSGCVGGHWHLKGVSRGKRGGDFGEDALTFRLSAEGDLDLESVSLLNFGVWSA